MDLKRDLSAATAFAALKRFKLAGKMKAAKSGMSLSTLYRRKKAGISVSTKSIRLGRPNFFSPAFERTIVFELIRQREVLGLKGNQSLRIPR
jgi:hypothetical protein